MNKKGIIIGAIGAVVVAAVVCIVLLLTGGEEAYRSIQVFEIDGTCTVTRDNDKLDAYKNMKLQSGDKFEVGDGSYARLKLDDDKFVYLQATTRISMTAEGTANDSKTIIFVENGSMTTEVRRKLSATSSYDIVTPNTTMSIRGTTIQSRVSTDAAGNVTTDSCILEGSVDYKVYEKDADGNVIAVPVELPQGAPKSVKTESTKLVDTAKLLDVISNDKKDETIEKTIEEAGIKVEEAVFTADDFVGVQSELANEIAKSTIDELLGITETEPTATPEVTPEATPEVTPEPQNNTADGPLTNDDIGDIVYVDAPAGGETADNDSDLTNTIDTGSQDNTDDTYIPTTPTPEQDDNDTNQGRDNGDDNSGSTTGDNTGKDDKDNNDNKDNTGKDDKDKDDKDDVTPAPTPEPTVTPAPTSAPDPTTTPAPTSAPDPTTTPAPTVTPVPTNTPGNSAPVEFKNTTVNVGQGQSVVVSLVDAQGHTADFSTAFGTYVVGSNSNKLPNSTTSTNGYRVKVSEGYEFTGWYLNASDAANNVTSKAIDSIPSNQSGTVQLFPGVKAKTYTLKIVNKSPEIASFVFGSGTEWNVNEENNVYTLTDIPAGTVVYLPEREDLWNRRDGYPMSSYDVGKIVMTADDLLHSDFICYSSNNQLEINNILVNDTLEVPATDEVRVNNKARWTNVATATELPTHSKITVNKDIELNAYSISMINIHLNGDFEYMDGSDNILMSTKTASVSNGSSMVDKLGTTNTAWKIKVERAQSVPYDYVNADLTAYYSGNENIEIPVFCSSNNHNIYTTKMNYEYYMPSGGLNNSNKVAIGSGYVFPTGENANAPFKADKSKKCYGHIEAHLHSVLYATLNLDGATITDNRMSNSDVAGILKSNGSKYTLELQQGSYNVLLPDGVSIGSEPNTLSGRTADNSTNDYIYLSKSGYQLVGYKLESKVSGNEYVEYLAFGSNLSCYMGSPVLRADLEDYYKFDQSKLKDFTSEITITPVFRSATPFSISSKIETAQGSSTIENTNNKFFVTISDIDTSYVKSISLHALVVDYVSINTGNVTTCRYDTNYRLCFEDDGVKLIDNTNDETVDTSNVQSAITTATNNGLTSATLNANIIWPTVANDNCFCFGIEKDDESGIQFTDIFGKDRELNESSVYDYGIDIGEKEKYHYLGIRLEDSKPQIKVIDNLATETPSESIQYVSYIDGQTTKYVGNAPYGGWLYSISGGDKSYWVSNTASNNGTRFEFPLYGEYASGKSIAAICASSVGGGVTDMYIAGVVKLAAYDKIVLNSQSEYHVAGASDDHEENINTTETYGHILYDDSYDKNYIYFDVADIDNKIYYIARNAVGLMLEKGGN